MIIRIDPSVSLLLFLLLCINIYDTYFHLYSIHQRRLVCTLIFSSTSALGSPCMRCRLYLQSIQTWYCIVPALCLYFACILIALCLHDAFSWLAFCLYDMCMLLAVCLHSAFHFACIWSAWWLYSACIMLSTRLKPSTITFFTPRDATVTTPST